MTAGISLISGKTGAHRAPLQERFIRSGAMIKDVFGRLGKEG